MEEDVNKKNVKEFGVRFRIVGSNIQVHMQTKNVNPQEALGLLDMAKDQMLENLRKGRQEVFSSMGKPESDNTGDTGQ